MAQLSGFGALFPGQGSQYVGMIKELRDQFPWTRAIFEEASDTLHTDMVKLCLEGPADDLQLTSNAQPAILMTSFAWFEVLRRQFDFQPVAGAGHSLGEYSALVAAGALTLTEGIALVRKRGELMQVAVPAGRGKMAAVLGLSDEAIGEVCRLATQGPDSLVVPANFNAPSQVVVAGHAAAVDRAETIATDGQRPELKARKVVPLKVSAPFHCPLMKTVATQFEPFLRQVKWQAPRFGIVHNIDGKLREKGDPIPLLRDQIDHPVQWTTCQRTLHGSGLTRFVELGPGKVLTGLGKRIVEGCEFQGMDALTDLKNFESKLKGTTP